MEGVFILDAACKPVLRSAFPHSSSPSYPLAIVDALNAASARGQLEPVVWIPHASPRFRHRPASLSSDDSADDDARWGDPDDGVAAGTLCCQSTCKGVMIACAASSDVSPSLVFAFIAALFTLLESYLKALSISTIQDHFDVVLQLVETALGSQVTDPALLKEVVVAPSLMAKVMSAVAVIGVASGNSTSPYPFSSPIPWRATGIKYQSNEIYLDLVESVSGIMDRSGKALVASVEVAMHCKCKLSGSPDLSLSFGQPTAIVSPSFHPCVRYGRWSTHQIVSFVPPDGRSKLMTFHYGPLPQIGAPNSKQPLGSTIGGGVIPLSLRSHVTVGDAGGSFSFSLTSKLPPAVLFATVKIIFGLGPAADAVQANISRTKALEGGFENRRSNRDAVSESQGGTWEFDGSTKQLVWTLQRFSAAERTPTLQGTWTHNTSINRPSTAVMMEFDLPTFGVTGIKIDKMKLSGESYSMYKGVKNRTQSGRLQCRW